jgi:hypothetical protein
MTVDQPIQRTLVVMVAPPNSEFMFLVFVEHGNAPDLAQMTPKQAIEL